jgi:hypothetical protein
MVAIELIPQMTLNDFEKFYHHHHNLSFLYHFHQKSLKI